jgi:GNAT superfamily N-acetyltransferase
VSPADVTVRPAVPADVPILVEMVHELAEYERAPERCHLTEPQLRDALFGAHPALFAQVGLINGEVGGMALWFLNFSTWNGVHGIYLEDLYVRPRLRRGGLGRALLQSLAALCVERGYSRFEWWVLDWNSAAHAFYRSIGAVPMDEWTVWRLTGAPLAELGHGVTT